MGNQFIGSLIDEIFRNIYFIENNQQKCICVVYIYIFTIFAKKYLPHGDIGVTEHTNKDFLHVLALLRFRVQV